jgi:hypothetical protein
MAIKKRNPVKVPKAPLSKKEKDFISRVDSAPSRQPWEGLDPSEKFSPGDGKAINVKFNRYEYELLKHLSQKENRSLHRQIKHILLTTLQATTRDEK